MLNKLFILVLIILISTHVWALRVSRPPVLSVPISEDQVADLNRFLEQMWNMQYGRFELDVVTTTKTNANNGEIWLVQTGSVARVQYRAADHIFTITPDGF